MINKSQPIEVQAGDRSTLKDSPATAAEVFELTLGDEKEKYQHLAADFENFRKRTLEEAERHAVAQKEALIDELLPSIAHLERALAVDAYTSLDELLQEVGPILQQLRHILRQNDIKPEES